MRKVIFIFALLLPALCLAFTPLPADQAFQFSVQREKHTLTTAWKIAPGYHLFKNSFHFQTVDGKTEFHNIFLPKGILEKDLLQGTREIYKRAVTIPLSLPDLHYPVELLVTYQGCADKGFCYTPVTQRIRVDTLSDPWLYTTAPIVTQKTMPHNPLLFLGGFFILGLLLSFTPCVFPLLPILLGIIIGEGRVLSALRAFQLSSTYVLGSASAYAAAGVFAGKIGSYVQALFQQSWIIAGVSMLFVLFAFSMFGWLEFSLPRRFQQPITSLNNPKSRGTFLGAALMGILSTLIVSPCITAPLVSVLGYISQTGNTTIGGSALFVMGLGMGAPLILLGTFGGNILPRAGSWMTKIKTLLGLGFLAIAVWLLLRIVPIHFRTDSFTSVQGLPAIEKTLAAAKTHHQPVILDFYAQWCSVCNEMLRSTFPHPEVQAALRNTLLLRTDVTEHNEDTQNLLKHFNLYGAPAILFFDSSGKEISSARILGGVNAYGFLNHLHNLQEQSLWPSPLPQ